MDEYAMLENIRAHSFVVARVAEALVRGLQQYQARLPAMEKVLAGALLHDIAKTQCLVEDCNHAEVGREMCVDLGYPEIGEIVGEHVILFSFSRDRYSKGHFTAKDIVYYADKRVRHDKIVSLDKRLEYIVERYGNNDKKRHILIKKHFQQCQELEKYLFAHLDFLPSDLSGYVSLSSFPLTG